MSRMSSKCSNCDFCKRVYFKGWFNFLVRRSIFYCEFCKKLVNADDVCENRQRTKADCNLTAERLDSVIKDIEWLKEYFGDV